MSKMAAIIDIEKSVAAIDDLEIGLSVSNMAAIDDFEISVSNMADRDDIEISVKHGCHRWH